jgi:DnaJ-class molecular chaperone
MGFCPKCGVECQDSDRYCSKCGNEIVYINKNRPTIRPTPAFNVEHETLLPQNVWVTCRFCDGIGVQDRDGVPILTIEGITGMRPTETCKVCHGFKGQDGQTGYKIFYPTQECNNCHGRGYFIIDRGVKRKEACPVCRGYGFLNRV